MAEKLFAFFKELNASETNKSNITVIRSLGIPFQDYKLIRIINGFIIIRLLKRKMNALNFHSPILITNSPVMQEVIRKLGETIRVFYCLDDYTAFEGTLQSMESLENELMKIIDVAFFISEELFKIKQAKPEHSYCINQGVNTEHFRKRMLPIPSAVQDIKKPIIGFMGCIAPWVDMELIRNIATRNPQWTFLIVGNSIVDVKPFYSISNMKFTGKVSYEQLPAYVQMFDIGLIPFKLIPVAIASNPLKLLEYFSMGIPVVSTPLPEIIKYKPLVHIGRTVEEFESAIRLNLATDDQRLQEARIQKAAEYSWENVVDNQLRIIADIEKQNGGNAQNHGPTH
jgi:glycosyltransferase involved in cell wall biosynthesis